MRPRPTLTCLTALALVLAPCVDAAEGGDRFTEALNAASQGDHGRAAVLFHDLAQHGDGEAAYNLAVLFASGNGVPQNTELALYWAWRARLEQVDLAKDLINRLHPKATQDSQASIAAKLVAALTPNAAAGDGAAMLQVAAVLAHVQPEPDLTGAYGWQSLAAMLDVPGAVSARDATYARIAETDRAGAQQTALQQATSWCAEKRAAQDTAPPACHILSDLPD